MSIPTYKDFHAAFSAGLFHGKSNSQMTEILLILHRKISSLYRQTAPSHLHELLAESVLDPAVETAGAPRPDPDIIYPNTAGGEIDRKRNLEMSAYADCFNQATSAMKAVIYQFVPEDIQDLLEVEATLDRQTVHGMLAILHNRYNMDRSQSQRSYLQILQIPYNPRAQTMDAYLSSVRHARTTLNRLGQPIAEPLFVELIATAILAGDSNYAGALDSYLSNSADRTLERLTRVLTNRASTLALASANLAQSSANSALDSPPDAAAHALVPAAATRTRPPRRGPRGGRPRNPSAYPSPDLVPDLTNIGALANQLQNYLHLQAFTTAALLPAILDAPIIRRPTTDPNIRVVDTNLEVAAPPPLRATPQSPVATVPTQGIQPPMRRCRLNPTTTMKTMPRSGMMILLDGQAIIQYHLHVLILCTIISR